jgi:hypothetical protein
VEFLQVVYGGGVFVVLPRSSYGSILVSSNGIDWGVQDCGAANWIWGLGSGPGNALVLSSQTLLTSSDGTHWSAPRSGPFPWGRCVRAVYAHGTYAVLCYNGNMFTSTNLTDWTFHSSGYAPFFNDLAFGNGRFVAVGNGGAIMRSASVPSWPLELAPLPPPGPAGFGLTASGPAGRNWEIDVSADLLGWTPLTNLWSTSTLLQFIDPDAPKYSRRFYRGQYW